VITNALLENGQNLLRSKNFTEACSVYVDLLEKDQRNGLGWYGLGISLMRTHQERYAFRALLNALALGVAYPDSLKALIEVAKIRKRWKVIKSLELRYANCFPYKVHSILDKDYVTNKIKHKHEDRAIERVSLYDGEPIKNLTLICHFYNEEYLLPWWLSHHSKIAANGILINYNSTDSSVDLCKKIAPHWKIVNSKNKYFAAEAVDLEVMEYEKCNPGWKLTLNVTEFLFISSSQVNNIFNNIKTPLALALRGVAMIAEEEQNNLMGVYEKTIFSQFRHGLSEEIYSHETGLMTMRSRILHSYSTGKYYIGRHFSEHATVTLKDTPLILWYGYAPWNLRSLERRLQIKNNIPKSDLRNNWGTHHLKQQSEFESTRKKLIKHSLEIFDKDGKFLIGSLNSWLFASTKNLTRNFRKLPKIN
jgi:hypothetical protein